MQSSFHSSEVPLLTYSQRGKRLSAPPGPLHLKPLTPHPKTLSAVRNDGGFEGVLCKLSAMQCSSVTLCEEMRCRLNRRQVNRVMGSEIIPSKSKASSGRIGKLVHMQAAFPHLPPIATYSKDSKAHALKRELNSSCKTLNPK